MGGPCQRQQHSNKRERLADLREAADVDDRKLLADQCDHDADRRDRIADQRDHAAGQRHRALNNHIRLRRNLHRPAQTDALDGPATASWTSASVPKPKGTRHGSRSHPHIQGARQPALVSRCGSGVHEYDAASRKWLRLPASRIEDYWPIRGGVVRRESSASSFHLRWIAPAVSAAWLNWRKLR
jgi:hypothetical protein